MSEFELNKLGTNSAKTKQVYDIKDLNKDGIIDKIKSNNTQNSIFTAAETQKAQPADVSEKFSRFTEETINEEPKPTKQENPKKSGKTKTVNGKTYSVNYDNKGNTTGVVVQNGESIAMIAKRFGCCVQEIIDANSDLVKGRKNNQYFLVGQEIKIPRILEPDDKNLVNRLSKEEAIAAYENFDAQKKDKTNINDSRVTYSILNKDHDTFEQMARALFEKEGVKNFSKSQLKQRIRELKKGNPDIIDGELKNKNISAKVSKSMDERLTQRNARNRTINKQFVLLYKAKDDLDQKLAETSWTESVTDSIKDFFGSKNTTKNFKEELATYENSMNELFKAAEQNDEVLFNKKFKEIYGISYNSQDTINYLDNPTEENYIKAFGSRNTIAKQVSKYTEPKT